MAKLGRFGYTDLSDLPEIDALLPELISSLTLFCSIQTRRNAAREGRTGQFSR